MSLLFTAMTQSSAWTTRPTSLSSITSTNGVRPRPSVISISFGSADFGSSCAVSRTADAPSSFAATSWLSRVRKSFWRSGRSVSDAASRSISSSPPNQRPVTTEMQGAPAATYSATISATVRSPISATPFPSWRFTSMITGRCAQSSASMKRLGMRRLPGAADRLDVLLADPAVSPARIRVDVDPEEEPMSGEGGVPIPVLGRDASGQEERPRQPFGERADELGVERLAGAPDAPVVGHRVEEKDVHAGALVGAEQPLLDALPAADVQNFDHAHVGTDALHRSDEARRRVSVQLHPVRL